MSFNANKPASSDLLSQSQIDIQTNFNQSNTIFGVDHVNFDNTLPAGATVANRGKHNSITLIERAADPTTVADEVALYSKVVSAVSTIFMRKESNGTVIQMSGPDPIIAATGSTFLPGGIILKWGACSSNGGGIVNNFASAFPTACWVVIPVGGDVTQPTNVMKPTSITTTGFTGRSPAGANGFYIAIGK